MRPKWNEIMINVALLRLQLQFDKNNHASMAGVILLLNGEVGMEVVIKPRESFSLCPQYGSFMKTAESNSGVTAINFKDFENKPLLHFQDRFDPFQFKDTVLSSNSGKFHLHRAYHSNSKMVEMYNCEVKPVCNVMQVMS